MKKEPVLIKVAHPRHVIQTIAQKQGWPEIVLEQRLAILPIKLVVQLELRLVQVSLLALG